MLQLVKAIIVQCVHDTTVFVHHVPKIMVFRNLLIFLLATHLHECVQFSTCCLYTDPGTPYFVEVRVQESMRGLGEPIQTGIFFSQETGEALLSMNYIQYSCIVCCFVHHVTSGYI